MVSKGRNVLDLVILPFQEEYIHFFFFLILEYSVLWILENYTINCNSTINVMTEI